MMIQEPPAFYCKELFVEQNSDTNLECPICHNVQKDPVFCKEGHGFCGSCISESATCPTCNEAIDVLVANRDAEQAIGESLVYCYTRLPYLLAQGADGANAAEKSEDPVSSSTSGSADVGSEGAAAAATAAAAAAVDHCTWTGKLKDASSHFNVCAYAGVVCSLAGCGAVVARKDKAGHEATCDHRTTACKWDGCDVKKRSADLAQHQLECPQRVVTCPNAGCGSKGRFDNLAAHRAGECRYEEVACAFAAQGCTARMLRKDVDSHEDTAMKQHLRLMMKRDDEQQQIIDKQQRQISELQQAHESLKHHVMPVDEIIVLQVKHDELTGKVPVVPTFDEVPTRLYSQDRVVRGYTMRLFVETNTTNPKNQDFYGVSLEVQGGPLPCKMQAIFELVHHDWNPASTVKAQGESTYPKLLVTDLGYPKFVSKTRLASPDNNPYVEDGYVTFTCTFSFDV